MADNLSDAVSCRWLDGLSPDAATDLRAAIFSDEAGSVSYALIDAAALAEGAEALRTLPGYFGSLFADPDLDDAAPHLLRVRPGDRTADLMFRAVEGLPPTMGTAHLWPSGAVLSIVTPADPATLRDHLRRFVRPPDARGVRRYVRLWSPGVMYHYLSDLTGPTDVLRCLFQGAGAPLTIVARIDDRAVVAKGRPPPTGLGPPILTEVDLRALTGRHRRAFHERLATRVEMRFNSRGRTGQRDRIDRLSTEAMEAMAETSPRDAATLDDHVRLVTVLALLPDEMVAPVLKGPVMTNRHLTWSRRVDIVARSYMTALRRALGQEVV